MDKRELIMLQSLPLEVKIAKSKLRVEEYVRYLGEDNVYISFSGGKDSTVLLHLVREIYPNIRAVFIDTGLEYPELRKFVNTFDNIDIVRPKVPFTKVIKEYGYPVVSKEQSNYIYRCRNTKSEAEYNKYFNGINRDGTKAQFKVSDKHKYLINAPFKISDKCCTKLKKDPVRLYERTTGRRPILGMLASESRMRGMKYMKTGCNSFKEGKETCLPLGFWTEQDILAYIKLFNLEIASVYGDIIEEGGELITTELNRTGCIFCMYGIHFEEGENRFQKLEKTHPQLHKYCMDKLGFKEVCEFMNIEYKNK